jgi:hypothetical protein
LGENFRVRLPKGTNVLHFCILLGALLKLQEFPNPGIKVVLTGAPSLAAQFVSGVSAMSTM